MIEEDTELTDTDTEIIVVVFIGNVPTERSELSSLLNDGVEEAKTEDKLPELLRFSAVIEEFLLVADGLHQVRTVKVGFKTLGWLIRHLHTILKDGHGEIGRRIGSEPEAEFSVSDSVIR